MAARSGSVTRKYTTASTLTETLSRVMPSWVGTGMVTICVLTFRIRSTNGIRNVTPGCRCEGSALPIRNTTPRSTWLTTRIPLRSTIRAATATRTTATTVPSMSLHSS